VLELLPAVSSSAVQPSAAQPNQNGVSQHHQFAWKDKFSSYV
jgi:hypothetical protein